MTSVDQSMHWYQSRCSAEPIIYRDISVDVDARCLHRTVTTAISTKPPDCFALRVRGLFFRIYGMDDQMAAEILEKCRSVRYLAIWSYVDPHRDSFPNLQAALTSRALSPVQMSLSQFILNPCAVTSRSFTHPILAHITHLDIPYQEKGDWDWASLELLRSLTHLSIDVYHWDPAQVARDAVQWCPNGLRVLALCLSCD
ncbi:hypothetical protein FA13DRAFT_1725912 [Coprinellus micaceus]|uniref:F-box domain-containing protein n=1 Tax=Coprinellus micaceus TaxID=71717 RepID=A0A4Y7TWE6_COPMI|nr:hypothetical protein FA13DRAFT_1725912 [Coprinellus micaceus]